MPTALSDGTVRLARVCIRGRRDDASRQERGIDRLLRAAELMPGGLRRESLLVVRGLDDPLPGALDPDGHAASPSRSWQQAVRASLESELRSAARPAAGAVPAAATAVLFSDRAELLACLAADWCSGDAPARWWWRALRLAGGPERQVFSTWAAFPAQIPAALEHLAGRGAAIAFATRLSAAEVAALTRIVALTFGLPSVAAAVDELVAAETRAARPPCPRGGRALAPWSGIATEAVAAPRPHQELFLGAGLMLRRAPAALRAARFARELSLWRREVTRDIPVPEPPADAASPRPIVVQAAGQNVPPEPPSAATAARPRRRADAAPAAARPPAPIVQPDDPRVEASMARSAVTTGDPNAAQCVETELGGLFYLVNVAQALGLYGDFTTPLTPGIALHPWDFVTLVGRKLLGRPSADPVWALLAELADRDPETKPGHGFRAPRAWRLPPAWLDPFDAGGRWRWSVTQERLQLRHPAGFFLLDLPVGPDPHAQLERELRPYRVVRAVKGGHVGWSDSSGGLERWVQWLTGYVRARAALALGVRQAEVPRLLLRARARVEVGPQRIDVRLPIDESRVEIRLAGLDRDPGWIPAAGTTLAFHFG